MKNKKRKGSGGFTLFFAILVASLLLSVGLAILEMSLKELELSALGRESQYAFYSADSGAECVLYWDTVGLTDGSGTVIGFATSSTHQNIGGSTITCSGNTINVTPSLSGESLTRHTFDLPLSGNRCAEIYIEKGDQNLDGFSTTTVEVRGYNRCTGSTRGRTERGLMITY